MLVVLNGYPGVGKLTIGRALAERLNGRLLDNHTIYNLGFALTTFRSPEFYEAVRMVQDVADRYIAKLPLETPLVLTETLAGRKAWGDECWQRILTRAESRGPLFVVHVFCEMNENIRRIQDPGRDAKRKPRDPDMVRRNHEGGAALMGADAEHLLLLDVSDLSADGATERILSWLNERCGSPSMAH